MADKLVIVMTFKQSFEAQLAKNLLENEGIESVVTGEFSSDILLGTVLAHHQIALQVREDDAQRAVALLAEVELNKDWEDEAESGTDVWICSICGEPVSNRLSMCNSCQTSRENIRAAAPRDQTGIQQAAASLPTGGEIQKPKENVLSASSALRSSTPPETQSGKRSFPLSLFDIIVSLFRNN